MVYIIGMQPAYYRLKSMVGVRMLAETTVLIILISLPLILWFTGDLVKVTILTQALLFGSALVALLVLSAYGFVTYKVVVDLDGLQAISLFRKQFMGWDQMLSLRLKTAFGWRRYVIMAEHDEVSFPVLLNNVDELVEQIRARLPKGGRIAAVSGTKVFAQDAFGASCRVIGLIVGVAFIGLFWAFFAYLETHKTAGARPPDPADAMIILVACMLFTAAMSFRSFKIVMMPQLVSIDSDGVTLQSWFGRRQFAWAELKTIQPPLFFLPEGIVVKTTTASYLIGNELDAFDELEEELRGRLPKN